MHSALALACALFALAASSPLPAVVNDCGSGISGFHKGDLRVYNGSTCYLTDGAVINGSILLKSGGNLHMRGRVTVNGRKGINGRGSGWVDSWGQVTVQQVDVFKGKWHSFYDTRVQAGELKIEASKGDITLCGTYVSDVVENKENTGNFYAAPSLIAVKGWFGCTKSVFKRDVKVEFLKGSVDFRGQRVSPGELYVKGVTGRTTLEDVATRKLKVERNRGYLSMTRVSAHEAEIKQNGQVGVSECDIDKIKCNMNANVESADNIFDVAEGQCKDSEMNY